MENHQNTPHLSDPRPVSPPCPYAHANSSPRAEKEPKEIDLLEVSGKALLSFGRFLSKVPLYLLELIQQIGLLLWRGYLEIFRFFWKLKWLFICLALLGSGLGFLRNHYARPYYETEMLVETKFIPRSQYADRINQLQKSIDNIQSSPTANALAFAKSIGITVADARMLTRIKADLFNVKVERPQVTRKVLSKNKNNEIEEQEIVEYEEELGPQFLRIQVRAWSPTVFSSMQSSIIHYMESDPYVQERYLAFQRSNLERQAIIQGQIDKIEQFQDKNVNKSSEIIIGTKDSPSIMQNEERTYVSEILSMSNEILALRNEYEVTRPVSVIQNFTIVDQAVNRLFVNVIGWGVLFVVAGVVAVLGGRFIRTTLQHIRQNESRMESPMGYFGH